MPKRISCSKESHTDQGIAESAGVPARFPEVWQAARSAASRFRQDLYYRLNVIYIKLPALRERREDIPTLARHFVSKYAQGNGRLVHGISLAAEALLKAFDWPGNVRQLENFIHGAVVIGSSEWIGEDDLPDALKTRQPWFQTGLNYHQRIREFKN